MTSQHNAHVYAFLNAPLAFKPAWTRLQMAEVSERLTAGGYGSADEYYADKDRYRYLRAGLAGKSPAQIDPMGHWFGMSSN